MTYDYGYGYSYTAVWSITFENDVCVKSICVAKFNSSELADAYHQGWVDDGELPVERSGNNVTIDYTSLHQGISKADLKATIEAMGGMS